MFPPSGLVAPITDTEVIKLEQVQINAQFAMFVIQSWECNSTWRFPVVTSSDMFSFHLELSLEYANTSVLSLLLHGLYRRSPNRSSLCLGSMVSLSFSLPHPNRDAIKTEVNGLGDLNIAYGIA